MQNLQEMPLDDRFVEGAVSLEKKDGWIKPWRIPFTRRRLFPPDAGVPWAAQKCSGVRLRFRTDSLRVGLAFLPGQPQDGDGGELEPRRFDVSIDGELVASRPVEHTDDTVLFDELPPGDKTLELWLPVHTPLRIRHVLVDPGATATVAPDDRPKWITYGSSITSCGAAHSPARTWPALVARKHRLHLTSLGFGGQCHIDPMIARLIRDLPADFVSLKLGINVNGSSSLSPRTFRPAIIGMVQIIREKHPDIPIALISPCCSPPRETEPNAVGFTLQKMREEVEDAWRRLVDAGDPNLHYFSGLDLFGQDDAQRLSPDLLHPNGDGYELLGNNFSRVVMSRIPL